MIGHSEVKNETKTKKSLGLSCRKYWLQIHYLIRSNHTDALKYMEIYITIDSPYAHKRKHGNTNAILHKHIMITWRISRIYKTVCEKTETVQKRLPSNNSIEKL